MTLCAQRYFDANSTLSGSGLLSGRPIRSYDPSPPLTSYRSNYPTNSQAYHRDSDYIPQPDLTAFRYVQTSGGIAYRAHKHMQPLNTTRTTKTHVTASPSIFDTGAGSGTNAVADTKLGSPYASSPQPPYTARTHTLTHPRAQTADGDSIRHDMYDSSRCRTYTPRPHVPKQQHPLYKTHNNIFGSQPPVQRVPDFSARYFPRTHTFTNTFPGSYRSMGLSTSKEESSVHPVHFFAYP